jgi:hypothetical protein
MLLVSMIILVAVVVLPAQTLEPPPGESAGRAVAGGVGQGLETRPRLLLQYCPDRLLSRQCLRQGGLGGLGEGLERA